MTGPSPGTTTSDRLLTGCLTVGMAATLLRDRLEQLSDRHREEVLDLLVRRVQDLAAGVEDLVHGRGASYRDRIEELETAAGQHRDRIEALEAAALDSEAAALVSDARILELASEIEWLRSARDRAAVIEDAKDFLMRLMQVSEDAAFAVLVAASQRDGVSLYEVAHRLTAAGERAHPS